MVTEATLERLRRVRAMTTSSFPAEADTARKMLARLLVKEGLKESDLDKKPKPQSQTHRPSWEETFRRAGHDPTKWYGAPPETQPPFYWKSPASLRDVWLLCRDRWPSNLVDDDITFEFWNLAELIAKDCEHHPNGYMKDMYRAITTRHDLTQPQARGLLNFIIKAIMQRRMTNVFSRVGDCLVCNCELHEMSIQRGVCWDDYRRVTGL